MSIPYIAPFMPNEPISYTGFGLLGENPYKEQQQLAEYNRQLSNEAVAAVEQPELNDAEKKYLERVKNFDPTIFDTPNLQFKTLNEFIGGKDTDLPSEAYALTFLSAPEYAYTTGRTWTFYPDSVIEKGIRVAPDAKHDTEYIYHFPDLLKKEKYQEYFGDGIRVDLSKVRPELANRITNEMGQSTTGFLVPGLHANFDNTWTSKLIYSGMPTEWYGGGIRGLGQDESGNLVYLTQRPDGKLDASGKQTYTEYRQESGGWFSDLFGGIGSAIRGFLGDTGPIGVLALNLAVPGLGTGLALGTGIGTAIAQGDLGGVLKAGAMAYLGSELTDMVRPEIAAAVDSLGLDPAAAKLLTDAGTKSTTAGILAGATGGDVTTAMQNAALNAGIGSLMSPAGPTQEDIDAIMNLGGTPEQIALTQDIEAFANLGGTPEQQADTALLDYQTHYEEELNKALGVVPQDIHPIDIPQEPPTSAETGIGLPGEEAAAQSLGGFGGTGNILGVEDYEEVAGKALAEAQAQAGGPGVDVNPPEPAAAETKSPSLNLLKPAVSSLLKPGSQARQDIAKQAQNVQQSYNQMLDQYLASQPMSVPFIANIPTRDLEEMFSGQTPIYWQGQA